LANQGYEGCSFCASVSLKQSGGGRCFGEGVIAAGNVACHYQRFASLDWMPLSLQGALNSFFFHKTTLG